MKKNILVPFDGSANAIEARQVAIDRAKAYSERLFYSMFSPATKPRMPSGFSVKLRFRISRIKWQMRQCNRVWIF